MAGNPRSSRNRSSSSSRSSSSRSRSRSRSREPEVVHEAPERDLFREIQQSVRGLRYATPQLLDLERKYGQQFGQAEAQSAAARGIEEFSQIGRQGTNVYDTLLGATPALADSVAALRAETARTGPSEMEAELRRQALEELRLGGELDAYDRRQASQGSRAAFQARGLELSSPSAVAEVLARTGLADQRAAERRAFAGQVEGLTTARAGADRSYLLNSTNTLNAIFDPQTRLFGAGGSVVSGQAASAPSFDNTLAAAGDVGRSNQQAALTAMGLNSSLLEQSRVFEHDNAMTRLNAGYASDISGKNNKAAIAGGALTGAGIAVAAIF